MPLPGAAPHPSGCSCCCRSRRCSSLPSLSLLPALQHSRGQESSRERGRAWDVTAESGMLQQGRWKCAVPGEECGDGVTATRIPSCCPNSLLLPQFPPAPRIPSCSLNSLLLPSPSSQAPPWGVCVCLFSSRSRCGIAQSEGGKVRALLCRQKWVFLCRELLQDFLFQVLGRTKNSL